MNLLIMVLSKEGYWVMLEECRWGDIINTFYLFHANILFNGFNSIIIAKTKKNLINRKINKSKFILR